MFIHLAVDQACQHVGELRHTIDRLGFRTETRLLGHQDVLECYESGKMCQEPNFTAPEYFSERFGLLPGLANRPKP